MRRQIKMPFLMLLVITAWFMFGDPPKSIANWLWENDAAPWEEVDAIFYPNREDLTVHEIEPVANVEACREWVEYRAAAIGDPDLGQSDYECGVGFDEMWSGFRVYRLTVK